MKIITKKDRLKILPETFKELAILKYELDGDKDLNKVYKLLKKEQNLTEETAIKIIGNNSWTENKCDDCGDDTDSLVQFQNDLGKTVQICWQCLKRALDMDWE